MKLISLCLTSYISTWQKSFVFKGKSSRAKYWCFTLANLILLLILYKLVPIDFLILDLLFIFPELAVTIRRLHDTNKSGWLVLIYFIPIVGWIIMTVLMLLPSRLESKPPEMLT
ncbi:MAG: DUF805 domain-containing protein [SAR324 cluster bacterium]|nr:DUF805 domain-containing protein [SAR324 cluster bacterium]